MCGIAGVFRSDDPVAGGRMLGHMLARMVARGPDAEGRCEIPTHSSGAWHVGARRLAILDLSPAGNQPMRDPATGHVVAHNGEVYNYRELRKELLAAGYSFASDCDTEVILHGFQHWGVDLFSRLEGMFACALWDQTAQEMLLVRDPHGIKPLYYFADSASATFLFASELRALLATGLVPRQLDPAGLDSFLKFGAVQEPATMVRGVRQLPAGHVLRWKHSGAKLWCYADLMRPENGALDSGLAHKDFREELSAALERAVRLRLRSDVPLGVFLSGGLDSTTIAALASAAVSPLKTFTVTFAEAQFSEGDQARATASALQTEHQELRLGQRELLASLPESLSAMDQPTVDGVNTYFISRMVRQAGITVALSGLGGDELFAGYRSFRQVPRMEHWQGASPAIARKFAGAVLGAVAQASGTRKLAQWLQGENGYGHPYFITRMVLMPSQVAALSRAEWLAQVDFSPFIETARRLARNAEQHDPVNRVSCFEQATYMRNMLLRDADCMSMAHSLEVRVPLLDHQLTRLLMRIPGARKLHPSQNKPLLLAAAGSRMPRGAASRPKQGFEFPWSHWLRCEVRHEVERTLAEPGAVLRDALQWDGVHLLWSEFLAGREHWSRPWLFYVLRKWTARHLEA